MHQAWHKRLPRSVAFRLHETWGRFGLRRAGVTVAEDVKAVGAAVVSVYPGSEIRLGRKVTLISKSFATALGVHHPVVLRTLAPGARIEIGRGTGISGGSICAARRITIGEETRLGANVTIADTDFHSLQPANRAGHSHPSIGIAEVHIGSRVLIGTNSIVLKGVSIGDNSVIGAGSVVTKSIPANCIAAGNPCRVLRELTRKNWTQKRRPRRESDRIAGMRIGFAAPISLRLMQDLVANGDRLPVGYEFAPSVDWVRQLLKRGHELTIYTTAKDVDEAKVFHGERLTVRIAKARLTGTGKDFAAKERAQLRAMMEEDRCDVIHAHWTYEFAMAALASGVPTLITVHDLPWNVLRFFRDKFRAARVAMAYSVALKGRYFTSVSTDAAQHYHRYFVPWKKVVVIPNGLPDAVFAMTDEGEVKGDRPCVFATILQGWSNRKNAAAALRAFALVRAQAPGTRLLMFGKDYGPGGAAEAWARQQGCAEGVTFVGLLPYGELLRRVRTDADVLVHPSLDESFSMAALEAMALKKPVIAGSKTPGVREVLAYGKAGTLLDVEDPRAIAAEMLRFATEPAYRQRIAGLGFQRAWSTYRTEVVFSQYEALYQQIQREAVAA